MTLDKRKEKQYQFILVTAIKKKNHTINETKQNTA